MECEERKIEVTVAKSKSITNRQSQRQPSKMTLKEIILLRKMESERDEKSRWNITRSRTPYYDKENDENLEEIRKQLEKNREKLLKLLNQAPGLTVQKNKCGPNKAFMKTDIKKQNNSSVEESELKNRHMYAPDYDSSSDDELQDPIPEKYPDLSDEECKDVANPFSHQFTKLSKSSKSSHHRHRVVRNDSKSSSEAETNRIQPKIHSSSRYHDPSKLRSFANPHKLSTYPRKFPMKSSKREFHQPDLLKLPYVSKGGGDYRSSRENAETTIVENKLLETFDHTKTSQNSQGPDHQGSMKSNNDPGMTLSSSGYSSSSSGNGSFSSSISNASFTMSSSPLATSSEHYRSKHDSANDVKSKLEKELAKQRERLTEKESLLGISNLKNPNKLDQSRQGQDSNLCHDKKEINFKETNHSRPAVKSSLNRSQSFNQPTQNTVAGRNSISMVEKPLSTKEKQRVRLRMPGSRSKKDEALRNSVAFAFFARAENEMISENEEIVNGKRDEVQSRISKQGSFSRGSILLPSYTSPPISSNRSSGNSSTNRPAPGKSIVEEVRHTPATAPPVRRLSEKNISENKTDPLIKRNNLSLKSLNSVSQSVKSSQLDRRSSFRNRLRGAFSFQNLKKAISSDKLEEDKSKSVSHSYLNEFGEDISKISKQRAQSLSGSNSLYKPPSIGSMFGSVRMRSKRVRERPTVMNRNSIACDPKPIPEYDYHSSSKNSQDPNDDEVGTPGYFRPIGRVLKMNVREGTMLIEMIRPPSGPFGFYVARNDDEEVVYVSSLSDSYPDKMFSGLMKPGDEILEVNNKSVKELTLDQIYDLILENNRLVISIKPLVSDPTR